VTCVHWSEFFEYGYRILTQQGSIDVSVQKIPGYSNNDIKREKELTYGLACLQRRACLLLAEANNSFVDYRLEQSDVI